MYEFTGNYKINTIKKPVPNAAMLAKLNSINPGLITIKLPIKPIITADHLLKPTFSS